MRLAASWAEQMHDFVTSGEQQLRDEASVALRLVRLRAHEARRGLRELGCQRLLPGVGAHPRRVAPERADADARESLLAGLPASAPAELLGVPVGDPGLLERRRQRGLPELRVPPRAREAPDVDERLHAGAP